MNKLLSTTALVVALSVPAMAFAQSSGTQDQTGMQQQNSAQSGFMAARGQSDIFASDLIGKEVYARRSGQNELRSNDGATDGQAAQADAHADTTDGQAPATEGRAQAQGEQHMNADGSRGMEMVNRSDIENMEQIGQINEIILSNDGEVRALVIGVGGFLGMGEQDVAVTMDQITFASDSDDQSQMYVVLNTSADMLNDAPPYDRTAMNDGTQRGGQQGMAQDQQARQTQQGTQGQMGQQDQRAGLTAPQMQRDGFSQIDARDVSTEMLMGQSVYDTQDNDVGSIDDMLLDEDGAISHVIIDFGGFLGIGSSQAAIGYDELTILATDGYSDVRIYVDATRDQIQNLPRYSARN